MVKASAVAANSKGQVTAIDVLKAWGAPEIVQNALSEKAVIGTTTDANFGSSLVNYENLTGEFIELLRGRTVVDRLAQKCVKYRSILKCLHKQVRQQLVG